MIKPDESLKPDWDERARICIYVASDGVTVYGNRYGIEMLGRRLVDMAQSPPSEHFETHMISGLQDYASVLAGDQEANVWIKFKEPVADAKNCLSGGYFEVTFMMATDDDLAKLR